MVSMTYLPCTIYPAAPVILSLILKRKFGAWIKEIEEEFVFASTSPDPHFDLQQRSVARSRTTSTKVTVDLKDARWSASDGKSSTWLKWEFPRSLARVQHRHPQNLSTCSS
jgi:hypothetical protein